MKNLLELFKEERIEGIRQELSGQFEALMGSEDKLKLLFFLLFLARYTQESIEKMDLDVLLTDLRERAAKAASELEEMYQLLGLEFEQDVSILTAMENNDASLQNLCSDIRRSLSHLEGQVRLLVEARNKQPMAGL